MTSPVVWRLGDATHFGYFFLTLFAARTNGTRPMVEFLTSAQEKKKEKETTARHQSENPLVCSAAEQDFGEQSPSFFSKDFATRRRCVAMETVLSRKSVCDSVKVTNCERQN